MAIENTQHARSAPSAMVSHGSASSLSSRLPGSLDERDPIATIRAADFAHHQMIARIHGADLDFLIRKDRDDAVLDVDDHLLVDVGPLDRELLERPKIRLPAPRSGVARIDMNRDQLAVRFDAQDELASARAPLLAETWRLQPGAIKVATLRRAAVVDRAPAAAGCAVRAPCSRRFCERIDPNELAAERTVATAASRHDRNRVSFAIRHRYLSFEEGMCELRHAGC